MKYDLAWPWFELTISMRLRSSPPCWGHSTTLRVKVTALSVGGGLDSLGERNTCWSNGTMKQNDIIPNYKNISVYTGCL